MMVFIRQIRFYTGRLSTRSEPCTNKKGEGPGSARPLFGRIFKLSGYGYFSLDFRNSVVIGHASFVPRVEANLIITGLVPAVGQSRVIVALCASLSDANLAHGSGDAAIVRTHHSDVVIGDGNSRRTVVGTALGLLIGHRIPLGKLVVSQLIPHRGATTSRQRGTAGLCNILSEDIAVGVGTRLILGVVFNIKVIDNACVFIAGHNLEFLVESTR